MNCRSLLCNFDDIVDFICSLNNLFDVICMSETWLIQLTEDQVNITGFTFVGKHRKNKKGGGVGIYVKNELKFKIRNDIISNSENCEIIAIEIINPSTKNTIIISLYRCPGTDIDSFNDVINTISLNIKNENKSVYWAGDYNINILQSDSHNDTGEFLHTMISHSFYPGITKPTRITKFSATSIDNIFTNVPVNMAGIFYKDISDHLPIFIINDTKDEQIRQTYSIESRELGPENILKLQEKLENFD
jgi:exonuclease III